MWGPETLDLFQRHIEDLSHFDPAVHKGDLRVIVDAMVPFVVNMILDGPGTSQEPNAVEVFKAEARVLLAAVWSAFTPLRLPPAQTQADLDDDGDRRTGHGGTAREDATLARRGDLNTRENVGHQTDEH